MATKREKEKIAELIDRTVRNCYWHEENSDTALLVNEIGVLRGLYYAAEVVGGYPFSNAFFHFIDVQEKLKKEGKDCK